MDHHHHHHHHGCETAFPNATNCTAGNLTSRSVQLITRQNGTDTTNTYDNPTAIKILATGGVLLGITVIVFIYYMWYCCTSRYVSGYGYRPGFWRQMTTCCGRRRSAARGQRLPSSHGGPNTQSTRPSAPRNAMDNQSRWPSTRAGDIELQVINAHTGSVV